MKFVCIDVGDICLLDVSHVFCYNVVVVFVLLLHWGHVSGSSVGLVC